jgi:hypothetical protein
MSRRQDKQELLRRLEGLVTFFGSYHAMRAESVLKKNGRQAVLVAGPREISPNCGVALRFDLAEQEEVRELLERNHVQYEDFHHYPLELRDR